jgi:hypothetical protein
MFVVYSPDYHFVTLGDHVFPMLKYDARAVGSSS